jgi:UDP-2-acetamido-3-amino-2,3-dideoxy-glucuronate N-acetyltransferase
VKRRAYWAHPTAAIDRGAHIGAGTKIWHFCHLMRGARVGAGCVLGQNVFVSGTGTIGERCRIQNNVSLYDAVVLEDDVFIGPSAVFTNVRNPRADVDRQAAFEPTVVGRGATVGANATVVCGLTIGAYAFVGAGAVVTRDVAPHTIVTGVPARQTGWICRCGETRGSLKAIRVCVCVREDRPALTPTAPTADSRPGRKHRRPGERPATGKFPRPRTDGPRR